MSKYLSTKVVVLGTHPWCCTNDEPILRTVQNDILEAVTDVRSSSDTCAAGKSTVRACHWESCLFRAWLWLADSCEVIKEQRAKHPQYPVALLGDMTLR